MVFVGGVIMNFIYDVKSFVSDLKAYVKGSGLSYRKIQAITGISASKICRIVNDQPARIDDDTIIKLLKFMNRPVEDYLNDFRQEKYVMDLAVVDISEMDLDEIDDAIDKLKAARRVILDRELAELRVREQYILGLMEEMSER
jgi:transcriptional regulator with XRE-family HTH domain